MSRKRSIVIAVTSVVALGGAGITLAATANAAEEPNTAPGGSHRLSTFSM